MHRIGYSSCWMFHIQEKKLSRAEVKQKLVEEKKKHRAKFESAVTMADLRRVDFKIKRKNSRYDENLRLDTY